MPHNEQGSCEFARPIRYYSLDKTRSLLRQAHRTYYTRCGNIHSF